MTDSPSRFPLSRGPDLSKTLPPAVGSSFLTDSSEDSGKAGNIKVVCRFRPINDRERSLNLGTCVDFSPDGTQVVVNATTEGNGPLKFSFDHVFPPSTPQAVVYEAAARPTVESVLEGFNGTVFAYGQTGSGKTFTMTGANVDDENLKGIIPRMITTVFNAICTASDHLEFTVKIGYCEIYMEKIKDLLNPVKNNLKVHEDKSRGVYIADLTEEYVSEEVEVYNLMKIGTANREVAATQMNEGSSRSHSLFLMTISQNNTLDFSAKTGKLYLVDLAGSEKVGKTGAEGKRLDEAKTINKSLSTLGLVIYSLTDGKSTHVPYRDSKLTRVLQDSLGGNSKTALIITCSPSPFNEAETIGTLRFGMRAKQIKNKPKVNKEYTIAELKLLLSKADAEVAKKERRIQILEKALTDAGIALPTDDLLAGLDEQDDTAIIPPPEMEEMRQELEDTRQKLSEQAEVAEEFQAKFTQAEAKNHNLLKQREQMNKQLNELLNTIHSLEERNNELDDQLHKQKLLEEGHQQEINSFVSAKIAMEARLRDMEAEVDRLLREQTVRDTRVSLTVMTEEIEKRDARIAELQAALEARDSVLTHIAVASSLAAVHKLIQESGNLNAKELLSVQQQFECEKETTSQLRLENEQLKSSLEQALSKKVNLEEVRARMKQEATAEFEKLLAETQGAHLREMSGMTEKLDRLVRSLEQEQENYRNLVNSMSEGERQLKKKTNSLEHNLEQLTVLYNQLAQQKSVLKIEAQVSEKKIKRKSEENLKLLAELDRLKKENNELKTRDVNLMFDWRHGKLQRGSFSSGKMRKLIRGGKHNLRPLAIMPSEPPSVKTEATISENAEEEERRE